jgi:solute carrier family 8 (sodium/calcium exchanger)
MFKVKLEKPEPAGVKISKKNVCLVTISKNEEFDQEEEDKRKLIEFYMAQKEVTWTSQFRTAITLGP